MITAIIFLVVGLGIAGFGIPTGGLIGVALGSAFSSGRDDREVFGFIIGWFLGLVFALGGAALAIYNAIQLGFLVYQRLHS
jgi:hypothetical protein